MSKPKPPRQARAPKRFQSEKPLGPHSERTIKIAGLPAVTALFKRNPDRILRFFYEEQRVPLVGAFCAYMARLRRPYRMVDAEELARIAGTVLHGGIVAVAEPQPVPSFDLAEARRWARGGQALFILDGVGNSHNLGAIARTLAFFGFHNLVISDHSAQAGLSDSAYRIAEGGLEYLQIRKAKGLPEALKRLKHDYRILGTALERGVPLEAMTQDPRPAAVVLGNEEEGLSHETLAACEAVVTLPGTGQVQSLNVSATAAILAYTLRARPGVGHHAGRVNPPPGKSWVAGTPKSRSLE
ncbi:RNA methyltransferase, TrmH family [Methylocaldum marinum]|uniref:RNA methyltransferase, TrmH family n=1 Tax=Methylocaldum marinum TaxID=1432792 RepID=A0A250KVX3_9GAMM|nr:RNA methyltransferase [Methylocaldum marinum]BBA35676.1 RNA methyltransferase, TrmH family [Methylocaldum marinum]